MTANITAAKRLEDPQALCGLALQPTAPKLVGWVVVELWGTMNSPARAVHSEGCQGCLLQEGDLCDTPRTMAGLAMGEL